MSGQHKHHNECVVWMQLLFAWERKLAVLAEANVKSSIVLWSELCLGKTSETGLFPWNYSFSIGILITFPQYTWVTVERCWSAGCIAQHLSCSGEMLCVNYCSLSWLFPGRLHYLTHLKNDSCTPNQNTVQACAELVWRTLCCLPLACNTLNKAECIWITKCDGLLAHSSLNKKAT